jgi:hypothetical protein
VGSSKKNRSNYIADRAREAMVMAEEGDARAAINHAFQHGMYYQRQFDRADMFAAIRRAAEQARFWDADADRLRGRDSFPDEWQVVRESEKRAALIRAAIRAAIGSDKT